MKATQFKDSYVVSNLLRSGPRSSKVAAAITLLVVALIAPVTDAALKILPLRADRHSNVQNDRGLPKHVTIHTATIEASTIAKSGQKNIEHLFTLIVGAIMPVSILSLLFYLQHFSEPNDRNIIYSHKSS